MSVKDCKNVIREYICEIEWLKDKIKQLEIIIKVKDEYIEKLEKKNDELKSELIFEEWIY